MEKLTKEEVALALGNMNVMQVIALTKQLEELWGVKAEPVFTTFSPPPGNTQNDVQTEFDVVLVSVPVDKKINVIKAIREVLNLGLKESKELVESAPKTIKESLDAAAADAVKVKLTEAGAVIELK